MVLFLVCGVAGSAFWNLQLGFHSLVLILDFILPIELCSPPGNEICTCRLSGDGAEINFAFLSKLIKNLGLIFRPFE